MHQAVLMKLNVDSTALTTTDLIQIYRTYAGIKSDDLLCIRPLNS